MSPFFGFDWHTLDKDVAWKGKFFLPSGGSESHTKRRVLSSSAKEGKGVLPSKMSHPNSALRTSRVWVWIYGEEL